MLNLIQMRSLRPGVMSCRVSLVTVKHTQIHHAGGCGLSGPNVISNVGIGLYFWGASTISMYMYT
jgi:hypothetical protein